MLPLCCYCAATVLPLCCHCAATVLPLCCCCCSEYGCMQADYVGNLAVFPRSHHILQELILEGGLLKGVEQQGAKWSVTAGHSDPWYSQALLAACP